MHAGSFQIRVLGILIIGVSSSYIACGGGGGGDAAAAAAAAAPSGKISVRLSPPSPSVTTGATLDLTASVSGTTDTGLTWTVDNITDGNATVGTITGPGTAVIYTAPASAGTHIVRAISQADTSQSGSTTVQVNGLSVVVALTPPSASVGTGGTCALSAAVSGASNPAVTWDVDGIPNGNATVGLLSISGSAATYTAPTSPGSHAITATSVADTNQRDSSTVTVVSGPTPISVALAPVSASLATGGSQSFTATVSGSSNTSVTWTVDNIANGNATVGALTGSGNTVSYRAPGTAGSHTIKASSVADTTKTAAATVAISSSCAPAPTSSFTADVKSYGAKGDGSTDDTAAIQSALNACGGTGGTVTVPAGTYMINALTSLYPKSNTTLSLASGAVLKAITNSSTNYAVLRLSSVSHVNIVGGTIQGERSTHTGTGGEWGHGIVLNSAQHVVIEGVTAKECWGDGIDVAASTDVTICNVTADHNRRQGMSITSVNGMVVRNSTFKNTTGTLPEDGIDIEPNPGETVANVLITGCSFTSNSGFGVEIGVPLSYAGQAWITGVVVDGNTCTGNGVNTLSTSPRAGIEASDTPSGAQITNNTSSSNGLGILLRDNANGFTVTGNITNSNSSDGIQVYSTTGNTITGNTAQNNGGHGIYSVDNATITISGNTQSGNKVAP